MGKQEDVEQAIRREDARLARLERERKQALERLSALKEELKRFEGNHDGEQITSSEKLSLFMKLFRGRDDVYAKRWTNAKKDRSGYSPACANEWVRGVCEKPKVKCGDCTNRDLIPITEKVILDHLHGRIVAGVYPLLENETCWFLAADFDDTGWEEDVRVFLDVAKEQSLAPAIERSRSGKGAHAWIFFQEPVAASLARAMGCHLITLAMSKRDQLGMASYDRLFPNQDTMPKRRFGNLIALPFQGEARKVGNTLFLDEFLKPREDQWGYLNSITPVAPSYVEGLVSKARSVGQVIGVRTASSGAEDEEQPWERRSKRRARRFKIADPLPDTIHAVIAQRLFVEKDGLPPALLNLIKRLAAFQNPDFYKKQNMRLSTALTPRVISCAEEHPQHIGLPKGCLTDLEELLSQYGVSLSVRDERTDGETTDFSFDGQLMNFQKEAVQALLEHNTGVFVAPPGVGKTVVGIYMIAQRARNTLVLVNRVPLLDQWRAQLQLFLGLEKKDIGQIGAGKRRPNGRLDVAIFQSLVRREDVNELVEEYGHVVVDECHRVPAVSFERILNEVRARYILGLTATPQRRDGHHPILQMQCGPVRFSIDSKEESVRRPFSHRLIVRETSFHPQGTDADAKIHELYALMTQDQARTALIVDDVIAALEEGRSPIVLTERREHLDLLAENLRNSAKNLVVLHGGMSAKERRETAERLSAIPRNEERLMLATGRYIGEGFDDPRLDTLFLTMPVSWKGTLIQYSGRLHRTQSGKTEVRIYDYLDGQVPMLAKMFERRSRGYRAMGYSRDDELDRTEDEDQELTVEWDEEALRHFENEG